MADPPHAKVRIVPHARGPWLLYTEGRCFLVPPELGRSLARVAAEPAPDRSGAAARRLLAGIQAAARVAPRRRRRRAIWCGFPILPAVWVDAAARRLTFLASWPLLVTQATVGAAGYALASPWRWERIAIAGDLPRFAGALGLFGMLALWHELGHAAALRREGYPAGGVGIGLLLVLPVVYCDVTPLSALARAGRIRVDLAGMAFQLGAGGMLLLAGDLLSLAAPSWAALSGLLALGWSLLPFARTDGYWFLADLLGLDSLDRPLPPLVRPAGAGARASPPWRRRGLAAILVVYRLLHALFLAGVALFLPWRLLSWAHRAARVFLLPASLRPAPGLAMVLLAPLAFWLLLRLVKRLKRLLRAAYADAGAALGRGRASSDKHRGAPSPGRLIVGVRTGGESPHSKRSEDDMDDGDAADSRDGANGEAAKGEAASDEAAKGEASNGEAASLRDEASGATGAIELVIDGCLDLHQFAPREVKELVPEYLRECRRRGILDVRIVHGKGSGVLRTIVHGILARHSAVESFGHLSDASSWGATVARLRPWVGTDE